MQISSTLVNTRTDKPVASEAQWGQNYFEVAQYFFTFGNLQNISLHFAISVYKKL